jgi:class 3 adenylate cyclase
VDSAELVDVTCCFTDIQSSTQLLRDLGPARYQHVLNEHFTALRKALRRHDGTELGTSGDGMFMAFPDPAEALEACVEAQRSFARIELGGEGFLRVRMGVHTGPAMPDAVEGFVGLTVHEAARIMSAAHGGQILLSARTASLVPEATSWNLGMFLLKDIEGPVELHQLRHDKLQANFPTVRARSAAQRTFPEELFSDIFVGRSTELQSLQQAWRASNAGHLGAVLVGGEAGVGKTTLVGRLAADAYAEGATVLYGRSRRGLVVPYQPFGDALSTWTASASDDDLAEVVDRWGTYLCGLLPDLVTRFGIKEQLPDSEPAVYRFHQLQGLSALLSAVGSAAPLLLVLDDMQWADASSVHLLTELTHHGGALSALIVVIYRDVEVEADSAFDTALSALRLTSCAQSMRLTGLDTEEVAQLAAESGEGARTLHRLTGGNPFLLRQVFTTGSRRDRPLPVADLIASRAASLGRQDRSVLAAASVVGSEFGLDVLGHVTGLTMAELLEASEECAEVQLIEEIGPGRFRFLHDLIWESLLSELSASRQAHLHGLVGDALEREPPSDSILVELAYHFSHALDAERRSKAVDYALAAGARAWQRLAFEAAIEQFDLGMATLDGLGRDDPSRRMDLLYERGRARLAATGSHWELGSADLWAVIDLAEAADDLSRATDALILLSWSRPTAGDDARLSEQQLRCLARLEYSSEGRARYALLLAARGRYLAHSEGQGAEGRRLTAEALRLARSLDDRIVLRQALASHLGSCIGEPIPERSEWTDEFDRLAVSTGSDMDKLLAFRYRAVWSAEEGDAQSLRQAVAQARDLRFDAFEAFAFEHLDTVEPIVLKGIEEARYGEAMGQIAILRWWQDRAHVNITSCETLLQVQPNLGPARAVLALALTTSGRRARAKEELAQLEPGGVLRVRDDLYRNGVIALISESVYLLGDPTLAAQLCALMAPLSGRLVTLRYIVTLGSADRYLAMYHTLLGEFDAAFAAFENGLDLELSFGSTTLASQTRLAYARALARAGRRDDAGAQARAAIQSADQTGVAFVIRSASELLHSLG